jgi:hypothetical protein
LIFSKLGRSRDQGKCSCNGWAFAIDHVGSTPANAFESSELVVQTLIVAAHPAVVVAQKCELKPQVFPPSREHKRAVCGNAKDTAVEIFMAAIIPSIDSEGTNGVLANDLAAWHLRALRGMTEVFTGLTESGS